RESSERDVGRDDADVAAAAFVEQHGQAVGLLPVAAGGAPDGGALFADLPREVRQRVELSWVAEEIAVLNGDPVQQIPKRLRLRVDHLEIGIDWHARLGRTLF